MRSHLADLTQLLASAREGDDRASREAFALVYDELRRLARAKLRPHATMTMLDTTSLVHESFMRFVESGKIRIASRSHFFAYAARVMRSVIVDFAREKLAERRGGGEAVLTLNTAIAEAAGGTDTDVIRVHDALEVLAQVNPRLVSVVEMRYFGGYNEREIAEALGVAERTVKRDWEKARLLLRAALS
jgi:RNA polymerase sigma factor (TIGR02999 family)